MNCPGKIFRTEGSIMFKRVLFFLILFLLSFIYCFAETDKILEEYEEALELEQSDMVGAIAVYNEIINKNPDFIEAYIELGKCYRKIKDYDNSIILFNKLLKSKPSFSMAYEELGWIYLDKNQINKSF